MWHSVLCAVKSVCVYSVIFLINVVTFPHFATQRLFRNFSFQMVVLCASTKVITDNNELVFTIWAFIFAHVAGT